MRKHRDWVARLKDYWQVVLILIAVGSAIGMAVNLPKRVEAVEQEVDDLKGWAREVQGYTRAMQQQQQTAHRLPLDYWTDEDGTCYQCDPNVSDCANSWDGWWRCVR